MLQSPRQPAQQIIAPGGPLKAPRPRGLYFLLVSAHFFLDGPIVTFTTPPRPFVPGMMMPSPPSADQPLFHPFSPPLRKLRPKRLDFSKEEIVSSRPAFFTPPPSPNQALVRAHGISAAIYKQERQAQMACNQVCLAMLQKPPLQNMANILFRMDFNANHMHIATAARDWFQAHCVKNEIPVEVSKCLVEQYEWELPSCKGQDEEEEEEVVMCNKIRYTVPGVLFKHAQLCNRLEEEEDDGEEREMLMNVFAFLRDTLYPKCLQQ